MRLSVETYQPSKLNWMAAGVIAAFIFIALVCSWFLVCDSIQKIAN